MSDRVVDEVGQRAVQVVVGRVDRHRSQAVCDRAVHRHPGRRIPGRHLVDEQSPSSTAPVTRADEVPAVVGAGEQQQVLDERRTAGRPPGAGPRGSRPPSPSRVATSSWVRIVASGLRSSCAASATNARWVRRAPATRSSISLSVVASAAISSRVGGTGSRSSVDDPSMLVGAAAQLLDRLQRCADDPPRDERRRPAAAAGRRRAGGSAASSWPTRGPRSAGPRRP